MTSIGGIEESRRLQEVYARLTDDELQAVANDGYDLTDVARQALQSELLGRGLQIEIQKLPTLLEPALRKTDFDPSDLDLAVVNRVYDSSDACEAKRTLDAAGIPSYFGPENLEKVEESQLNFKDGIDLKVRAVDSQHAMQALSRLPAPAAEDDSEYVALCPKCHSSEIVFQGLDTPQNPDPALDEKFNWHCDACGNEWRDDGIEQQA